MGNLIKQDGRFGNFEKKILYIDVNNLYGSCQTLALPLKDFRWDNDFASELENFFSIRSNDYSWGVKTQSWNSYFGVGEQSTGYYIETNISFSDKDKKNLKDFPPTHTTVYFDDFTAFAQKSFVDCHSDKKMYRNESKLMLMLDKKDRYVIHSALADNTRYMV